MADAIDFDRMRTLGDVARYHAEARPDAVALVFEGRETSFADFDRHTNQVANALIAAGLKVGDRVAYVGKNSDHYFELLIGAAKAGVVTTPIGWRLAAPEIAYIVGDSEAKLVFVGPELIGHVEAVAAELTHRPVVIAMEAEGAGEHRTFEAWRDAQPDTDPMTPIKTSDIAIQLYTSGTTGRPKGAMLTHDNMLAMRREAALRPLDWNQWGPDDVSLVAMPVAHIGGTGWGLVGLFNGAKGVVAREFDPTKVLDFIEKDRVSKMFMVPAALQIVVRLPRAREVDYSRLSHILYGAAPIPLDLLRECMEVFGCGFVQQYGMTETTGTVVYLPPEDHDPAGNTRMRAAGLPMPGVEIKVIDEAGNSVPAGTVGEVAIRSLANMAGYWKLDEATKKTIDADGWLRTGDAGYLDEDGYLFIHDRVKDMIISGGENIYPSEVEALVGAHPSVKDIAVIGLPDDKWGERVHAVIVPRDGMAIKECELAEWAKDRLAGFKRPRTYAFITDAEMPRNATGKILHRELKKRFAP